MIVLAFIGNKVAAENRWNTFPLSFNHYNYGYNNWNGYNGYNYGPIVMAMDIQIGNYYYGYNYGYPSWNNYYIIMVGTMVIFGK